MNISQNERETAASFSAQTDLKFHTEAELQGALCRAQREVSTAIFFDDVVAAVVAGGVALGAAQKGALWLRETEVFNASTALGSLHFDEAQFDEANIANSPTEFPIDDQENADRIHFTQVENENFGNVNRESWICVLSHAITPDGAISARRRNEANLEENEKNFANFAPLTPAVQAATRGKNPENTPQKQQELAWPLWKNGRILGVLQIGWRDENALDDSAYRVLEAFCEHAALALSNARLFEQVEGAKREWQSTFDGLIDGICIEQPDGMILRANRVAAQLFGRAETSMPGCIRDELNAQLPSYEELRPLQPTIGDLSGRDVRSREFRFGTPSRIILETIFSLHLPADENRRAQPLTRSGDTRRVVRILRDITEQHRLEEQLIQSEKLAALGELISGVAHELNNPLTTVAGYAQLLQDDTAIPDSARRQIEYIYEEATRASRIVANLLAFARREEPRREPVDVNASLRTIVDMRAYQLQSENVRLTCQYADDLPLVLGDSHQLQQVFLNVINNAQQAMNEWRGGGNIEIATERVLVGGEAGVLISIRDNGPGIAPDHLRRLFDPFWTTKSAGKGTGLGMSLSLSIVSRHNGRIWAESTLGRGARFLIELAGEPESSHEENIVSSTRFANETVVEAEKAVAGAQILVVDDEENVIFLISEVLGLDDHEITPAFNGGEALALLQERDFDLILSDVRMPAVGGPTFFEILQTTRPDLLPRVVFVTGDTMSRSTQDFLRQAARPMLAKPFAPERLRALVREQLQKNEA